MNTLSNLVFTAYDIKMACSSFPAISISEKEQKGTSIEKEYRELLDLNNESRNLRVELIKRDFLYGELDHAYESLSIDELKERVRQEMIEEEIRRRKCIREMEEPIMKRIFQSDMEEEGVYGEIKEEMRRRDKLQISLQSRINGSNTVLEENAEYLKTIHQRTAHCDELNSTLHRQNTDIETSRREQLKNSTIESRNHDEEILQAEKRKQKVLKKKNAILRGVFVSLVLASKVDWVRNPRLLKLMMHLENDPGVPEEELK